MSGLIHPSTDDNNSDDCEMPARVMPALGKQMELEGALTDHLGEQQDGWTENSPGLYTCAGVNQFLFSSLTLSRTINLPDRPNSIFEFYCIFKQQYFAAFNFHKNIKQNLL